MTIKKNLTIDEKTITYYSPKGENKLNEAILIDKESIESLYLNSYGAIAIRTKSGLTWDLEFENLEEKEEASIALAKVVKGIPVFI